MAKKAKSMFLFKKESERTKTEKIVRDIVFYGLVVYVAVLGYLLVSANIDLTNAQTELVSNSIVTQHATY